MPIVRAKGVVLWLTASALVGCGGVGRLQPEPSHPVDLSGTWLLNRAASDDPQKIFDRLRPKAVHRDDVSADEPAENDAGDSGQSGGNPPGGNPPGGGSRRRGRPAGGEPQQPQSGAGYRNDAYLRTPLVRMLISMLARGDQVAVHQSSEELSLDYGSTVRTYTPGGKSVVSAEWGVADQHSGWKGKEYVIEVKPQNGVPLTERFGLSDDGKQLIEQLHMGGDGFPVIEMKRVYDHTDKPLTRGLPTND
jgi:hypothetical protein